jgi:hypothetical protein
MFVVAALIVVGLSAYLACWLVPRPTPRDPREMSNAHVRQVWEDAGSLTYPHEMSDGKVRWMNVYGSHGNALDL